MSEQKTAFIAIVGCPNVGKSSILNKMLGEKIAIVSPKPQTTRFKILGVYTHGDVQLVFTAERTLLKKIKKEEIPAILAINKIDLLANKEKLLARIMEFSQLHDFDAIVPISAKNGSGMNDLLEELSKLSMPSPHFFPDDTLTDQPEKVLAAEYIREKILRYLDKEIPHGTAVSIERFRERDDADILDIDATIYCEKESHKGIIIGKNGEMLKKISTGARIDLERFFEIKVNLKCWVKVKEDWRNREALIHNFGLD